MQLFIDPQGQVHTIYNEVINLNVLGHLQIRRASHIEPDEQGQWFADLAPMDGPKLGPFQQRSEALDAELIWLELNWHPSQI